jgi:hydrogenase maturation protein HypF
MHTYHIHINGLVQGVGFRPFVCETAEKLGLTGWVNNSNNGVHIEINATSAAADIFYNTIISNPPVNAIITHHHIKEITSKPFSSFYIKQNSCITKPDLLLTSDFAMCHQCRNEVMDVNNKRYHYPFTTCLNCGPRYSIITALPYDREDTTMYNLEMCPTCDDEFNNIHNRRHYSQTNSCKQCAIKMHLYNDTGNCVTTENKEILDIINQQLHCGSIIAVKGIGGYLLLCDATNETVISTLRNRKQRPAKPFALLYADIEMACIDLQLHPREINALKGKVGPIVLSQLKSHPGNDICKNAIAPGLDKIGLMLPYTPLFLLIAENFGKPLIATSANISGSPILYKDEDALNNLFSVADYILTYDRAIVMPQDDSVMQFTDRGQKVILRRSRGLAPNYYPNPFQSAKSCILATGGELKSAFALLSNKNLYVSQFLGDQGTLESQTCFTETINHFFQLLKTKPDHILIDKHPGYFVSQAGKEMAVEQNIPFTSIQHHKAHFGAVLGENNLLNSKQPVLGFIWDGAGYGDDGQIWGGEVFVYENKEMERVAHLDYFPQLLGDKMNKEPRLSALSLLKNFPNKQHIIQKHFSKTEWQYYHQILQKDDHLLTSSMGRFLDGISAILGICLYNTYEGEGAMKLEALARTCTYNPYDYYSIPLVDKRLDWNSFLAEFLEDWQQKEETCLMAWKVFFTLAKTIVQLSHHYYIDLLAFSGGVFQNTLLIDMIIELLSHKRHLYFHQQLSPNDECIGFGQLACFSIMKNSLEVNTENEEQSIPDQIQFNN